MRKVRVYTDEQKAAFRARMIAAREAKEAAQSVEVVMAEESPIEKVQVDGSKTKSSPKKVFTLPGTGRKVGAKSPAQW